MSNNNLKCFDNPYDYLQWEYFRQGNKKIRFEDFNIDVLLDLNKDKYDDMEFYEKDKELLEKIQKHAVNVETPINEQCKLGYSMLNRHSENIIKIAKENNISIPDGIVLGTLPLNCLEAFTCIFSKGQRLIALSEGLFLFLYSMGRVVSSFFSNTYDDKNKGRISFDMNKDSIHRNLKMNKKGHEYFIEIFIAYFVFENPSISRIYYQKDVNMNLSAILWDTAELFIVAHEYSHIILGHLPEKKEFVKKFLDDDSKMYQVLRNWEEEFSADILALELIMGSNKDSGYGIFGCYLGIEFLFACLDMMGNVYNIDYSETHPSAQMRIENLRQYFKNVFPEKSAVTIEASSIIQEIITELCNVNKNHLEHIINNIVKNPNFKKGDY